MRVIGDWAAEAEHAGFASVGVIDRLVIKDRVVSRAHRAGEKGESLGQPAMQFEVIGKDREKLPEVAPDRRRPIGVDQMGDGA